MDEQGLSGRDVFLRHGGGPVQHFRAWDAELFIASQVAQGLEYKDKAGKPAPYVVSVATREEYIAEHRKGRP
jgi:hypothetical protein